MSQVHQPSCGVLPQNARNAQNLLAEKSLLQMSADVHRLGGYGIPAIPTLPNSVYSVNSVGEQRTIKICVHPCHLWEKRYSHRTHGTHRTFWQRRASRRCSQIRRVWHPCHTHAAQFCVFCVFCGRTAHHNHLCSSVPSVGEKIFPQNAHTEPSGREEPLTNEHGCSQIRRVWHPCHTHAAKFRGRTAHHNHLCRSVPSVGVLSLQEGSVRSVHSVGGVAVVWCSRDCCTHWWCIRAIRGRFSQQSASVSSACSVGGNAHQICCEKLCANPVTCNANIVQAPST